MKLLQIIVFQNIFPHICEQVGNVFVHHVTDYVQILNLQLLVDEYFTQQNKDLHVH